MGKFVDFFFCLSYHQHMSTEDTTLTTEDLLTRTEAATGIRPSVHQLGDWVSAGLLPPSRPGAGRGRSVGGTAPRRWEAECLPRLILIVESRRGKQVSLIQAAQALAHAGYDPGAKYLRDVLTSRLFDLQENIEHTLTKHRTFLKERSLSAAEKHKRYHASVMRRYTDIDPAFRAQAEKLELVALRLAKPQEDDALGQMLFLMTEEIGTLLKEASDGELETAYRLANEFLPQATMLLPTLRPAFRLIVRGIAAKIQNETTRTKQTEIMDTMLDNLFLLSAEKVMDIFRLPITVMILLALKQGEEMMGLFDGGIHQMLSLFEANIQHALREEMQKSEEAMQATIMPASVIDAPVVDAQITSAHDSVGQTS